MTDTDTAAPTAHDQMMDAHFRGDQAGAQALSQQVNREAGIEQPQVGQDPLALAPMPAAPKSEASVADRAVATLTELGGEHAALVTEWQRTGANIGEELAYAKAAFNNYATPELIKRFDESGLGNHPAVLKLLAKHGRLDAGFMGDFSVARNNASSTDQPRQAALPRGQSAAQAEINRLIAANPPGTEGYKKVSDRIMQLNESIYGAGDSIVGQGGRTA